MAQLIAFPPCQLFEPLDDKSNGPPNIPETAELLHQLERERENLVITTNFLESLRARLGRQNQDEPHLSAAPDDATAKLDNRP